MGKLTEKINKSQRNGCLANKEKVDVQCKKIKLESLTSFDVW